MSRFVDRGAITAAYVGIGMAVTIGVSFLLIIPIEPVVWLLALPSGLLIGYYANQRSDRRAGPRSRIMRNAAFAGIATGLTIALFLLGVKALFFVADNGYVDGAAAPSACQPGAACVYDRYLAAGRGDQLEAAGVTDVSTFTSFYWGQQLSVAATLLAVTTVGGLGGGLLYVAFRPRTPAGMGARAS